MATQNLANADALLKDLYVGPIVEQLNYKTYMLDQVERDSDHIDHTGRRAVFPVRKGRNRGRGSRADGGTLPVAGRQQALDAIVPIRYHYGAIEVSDGAIEGSKSNEGAFVSLLEDETKGLARDLRKDVNRQVFGDGTGLLTLIRATEAIGQTVIDVVSIQYIEIGDPVDILNVSTGAVAVAGAVVTARSTTGPTITIDTALAAEATITTFGVYVAGSRNNEMDGLQNIINTSRTLHSINSATAGNEFWNGKVRSAGSVVAGESLFEQLADDVGGGGNGEVETFVTTRGIRRRLADTYQSQKRFNDAKAVDIHGGYTAIMVNELPVIADDDAPKGNVFGVNKGSFKWAEQVKPGWMEQKDSGVFHLKPGTVAGTHDAVWQAYFRWYAALACVAPNRNGRITLATDDAPS